MCPMCIMRTAILAVAAVSTGGLATLVATRFSVRKVARPTGANANCSKCDDNKETR